jgi:hypothetical protein
MTTWLTSALVTHLWQSTLFVLVVWLAAMALRQVRARVRYWLWVAASVKFLIPLSLLVGLGARFEWRTAPSIAQPAAAFVLDEVLAPPEFRLGRGRSGLAGCGHRPMGCRRCLAARVRRRHHRREPATPDRIDHGG